MRKIKLALIGVILITVSISLTGCIPPFIDGLVDSGEYLQAHAEVSLFTIDYSADGGFTEGTQTRFASDFQEGSSREPFRKVTFFTTSKMQEIRLAGIVFMVQPDREATLRFSLSLNGKTVEQTVQASPTEAATLFFEDLNISWNSVQAADGTIEIMLINVMENAGVSYAIGNFLLIAAE